MNASKGVIRVGTSGIVIPGTKESFPEEYRSDTRLHYYSTIFNSLEINSTFYKIPIASTFEKWSTEVLGDFRFTVKLWKGITHANNLDYNPQDIDAFMQRASFMGNRKGCLLVQFPARIKFSLHVQVEKILMRLERLNALPRWNICVEFRDKSWYENTLTYAMLDRYNASIVLHDMPASTPPVIDRSLDTVYLRFHGPDGDYKGGYSEEFLMAQAHSIKQWCNAGKNIYVYFNNTIGDAFKNALLLKDILVDDTCTADLKTVMIKSGKYAL